MGVPGRRVLVPGSSFMTRVISAESRAIQPSLDGMKVSQGGAVLEGGPSLPSGPLWNGPE